MANSWSDKIRWIPLFVIVLLIDIGTKALTHFYLPEMNSQLLLYPYGGIGVFNNLFGVEFSISHATNRGAAWGIFSNSQGLLQICRIVLVGGLVFYYSILNKSKSYNIPLLLIISGALGNILDYFVYGHVVDMLHFIFWGYDYPVFNVADSAIFIGIVYWFSLSFFCDLQKAVSSRKKK